MKKLLILMIAIFAICSLIAEVENVTFTSHQGSKNIYHVLGYGTQTAYPGPNIPAVGYPVTVIFSGSENGVQTFNYVSNQSGFYGVPIQEDVHPDHTHVTVIIEGFFSSTVLWESYARVDFLIDRAY
ncbi:MAG: hypothetical protein PHY08_14015 [Candidatus Cloacimonetes bacterium]|nr:hypothetical protein [Candidatus Cloacimonadota bacterium]